MVKAEIDAIGSYGFVSFLQKVEDGKKYKNCAYEIKP